MDNDFLRIWVNSEKRPWFAWDGFRVLDNDTIFERKKIWWIFGKWIVKYDKSNYDEVVVLDEAVIR